LQAPQPSTKGSYFQVTALECNRKSRRSSTPLAPTGRRSHVVRVPRLTDSLCSLLATVNRCCSGGGGLPRLSSGRCRFVLGVSRPPSALRAGTAEAAFRPRIGGPSFDKTLVITLCGSRWGSDTGEAHGGRGRRFTVEHYYNAPCPARRGAWLRGYGSPGTRQRRRAAVLSAEMRN
jgi:hypothetical protein